MAARDELGKFCGKKSVKKAKKREILFKNKRSHDGILTGDQQEHDYTASVPDVASECAVKDAETAASWREGRRVVQVSIQ